MKSLSKSLQKLLYDGGNSWLLDRWWVQVISSLWEWMLHKTRCYKREEAENRAHMCRVCKCRSICLLVLGFTQREIWLAPRSKILNPKVQTGWDVYFILNSGLSLQWCCLACTLFISPSKEHNRLQDEGWAGWRRLWEKECPSPFSSWSQSRSGSSWSSVACREGDHSIILQAAPSLLSHLWSP